MTLNAITIVLDGEPYIRHHLAQFEKLQTPWRWVIVEGVARNIGCTSWCRPIPPRLSSDGTTEYLEQLQRHPNVTVLQKPIWDGKLEMFNAAVLQLTDPGVLMEIDADELWNSDQLTRIMRLFRTRPQMARMNFFCRYFVGERIVTTGDNCYGNKRAEWQRAWRFEPGTMFQKHEPPVFNRNEGLVMGRWETKAEGLVFDHKAYAMEKHVAFKEHFYGYKDAVAQWRELQANTQWPVKRLKDYLPWVDEAVGATLLT